MSATASPTSLATALRAHGFVGRVVAPGDPGYDAARAGWNGAIDRRPAAVAHATDADDVSAAVRAARASGTPFTLRAGGHSVSGRSVRDDALCIDVRALNAVDVDPEARVVRAGGGTLLGELDAATQAHGLAVPAGQISHTGVGGLTLGGGVGWLMRHHGLTIDSLLAADAVLADGRQVRASADEHPDLFWALRGGGGDFAAVTSFTFRAHPVGPAVLGGMLVFGFDQAPEVLARCRALMAGAPDPLTIFAVVLTAPPEPPFPPEVQGGPALAVALCWSGDVAEGERVIAPLRAGPPPLADLVAPMPFVALQSMLDATAPHGGHYYDRLHQLPEVSDAFAATLLDRFADVPTPQTHVTIGWLGGAVDRVAPGATAYGHRDARAQAWLIGAAADGPVDPVRDWVRATHDALAPFATGGTYVNALAEERPVRDAYDRDVYERLVAVKRRYDPDGAFSGNGIG
jgi:FAD/FMN-containing dehydrogenase